MGNYQHLLIITTKTSYLFYRQEAVSKAGNSKVNKILKSDTVREHPNQGNDESILTHIMLPTNRAMAKQPIESKSIPLKRGTHRTIHKSTHQLDEDIGGHHEDRSTFEHSRIKWKRIPREPIPQLSEISAWRGKQLRHENMPKKYQHMHPDGKLIPMDST